jgi:hypothetical protein
MITQTAISSHLTLSLFKFQFSTSKCTSFGPPHQFQNDNPGSIQLDCVSVFQICRKVHVVHRYMVGPSIITDDHRWNIFTGG